MSTQKDDPRLANLKPFPKGVSGNPGGRPKGLLTAALRRKLSEVDPEDPGGRTYAEVLAERMILEAKGGSVQALREVADRTEGKPRQSLTLTVERQEKLERAVEELIASERAEGRDMTRAEAISTLALFMPEASELSNRASTPPPSSAPGNSPPPSARARRPCRRRGRAVTTSSAPGSKSAPRPAR